MLVFLWHANIEFINGVILEQEVNSVSVPVKPNIKHVCECINNLWRTDLVQSWPMDELSHIIECVS